MASAQKGTVAHAAAPSHRGSLARPHARMAGSSLQQGANKHGWAGLSYEAAAENEAGPGAGSTVQRLVHAAQGPIISPARRRPPAQAAHR